MKFLLFIIVFCHATYGHAYFQELYRGYQDSKEESLRKAESKLSLLTSEILENKYSWDFYTTLYDQDSYTESLYSFNSQQTLSKSIIVGFERQTYKFGKLSFNYQETELDLSNWSESSLSSFSSDQLFESKYALQYEYEILNKTNQLDLSLAAKQKELSEISDQVSQEENAYNFHSYYLEVKKQVLKLKTFRKSLISAEQRLKNIKRRLRDGLSNRSDLYLAQAALIDQQNIIGTSQLKLDEAIQKLESVIQVEIDPKIIRDLSWDQPAEFTTPVKKGHKVVEVLKIKTDVQEIQDKKESELNDQRLVLGAEYSKNNYDQDKSMAREELQDNEFEDKKIFLTYSIPFGNKKADLLDIKKKLNKFKNAVATELKKEELEDRYEFLIQGKKEVILNYERSKQKEIWLEKTVLEVKKLFKRGQRNLDDLLRVEEQLTQASSAKYDSLHQLELTNAEIAYLSGEILSYLRGYKD